MVCLHLTISCGFPHSLVRRPSYDTPSTCKYAQLFRCKQTMVVAQVHTGAATGRSNSIYATTAAYCRLRHSDANFFAVFCRVFSSPVLRDILMQIFDVAYGRLHGATIRYKKTTLRYKRYYCVFYCSTSIAWRAIIDDLNIQVVYACDSK